MEKWFNYGDKTYMTRNMRAKGFMLKVGEGITVLDSFKIDDKKGSYGYNIEVVNPKTNEKVVLPNWVSQFHIMSKSEIAERNEIQAINRSLDDELAELRAKMKELSK